MGLERDGLHLAITTTTSCTNSQASYSPEHCGCWPDGRSQGTSSHSALAQVVASSDLALLAGADAALVRVLEVVLVRQAWEYLAYIVGSTFGSLPLGQ